MTWKIELSSLAEKNLERLDNQTSKRILKFLNKRLLALDHPREIGEPMKESRYSDMWKYRIGNYRVIARIQDDILTILVVELGHRSEIYRNH